MTRGLYIIIMLVMSGCVGSVAANCNGRGIEGQGATVTYLWGAVKVEGAKCSTRDKTTWSERNGIQP